MLPNLPSFQHFWVFAHFVLSTGHNLPCFLSPLPYDQLLLFFLHLAPATTASSREPALMSTWLSQVPPSLGISVVLCHHQQPQYLSHQTVNPLHQFTQAGITKCHRLGGLRAETYLLIILEAGSQVPLELVSDEKLSYSL